MNDRNRDRWSYILTVLLTRESIVSEKMIARLIKGDKCAGNLNTFFRSKAIRKGKNHVHRIILRPTVTCGFQTWVLDVAVNVYTLEA